MQKRKLEETNRWLKDQAALVDQGKFLPLIILLKCNKWPLVTQEEPNKGQETALLLDIHNTGAHHQAIQVDHQATGLLAKVALLKAIQAIDLQVRAALLRVTQELHKARDLHLKVDSKLTICSVTQILLAAAVEILT